MASVAALGIHSQSRLVADRALGMTREEAEGRGPRRQAGEVPHQAALDLLPSLAVWRLDPCFEALLQRRRGDEQRFPHLRLRDDPEQPLSQYGAISDQRG